MLTSYNLFAGFILTGTALIFWTMFSHLIRWNRRRQRLKSIYLSAKCAQWDKYFVRVASPDSLGSRFGDEGTSALGLYSLETVSCRAIGLLQTVIRIPTRGLPDIQVLAALAMEVAGRLRAGSPLAAAWKRSWNRRFPDEFKGLDPTGAPISLLRKSSSPLEKLILRGNKAVTANESSAAILVLASRFSFLCGAPLAEVLEQAAQAMVQAHKAHRAQLQAFTGPKLSARVLMFLPVLALGFGQIVGASPLKWLMSSTVGHICLFCGVFFLVSGFTASRKLINSAQKRSSDEIEATIFCDLAQAGLRGGSSIPTILSAIGRADDGPLKQALPRVAVELVMGETWEQAWDPIPPKTNLLYDALQPGWDDGMSPLNLLKHTSQQVRERHVSNAQEEAAKLSVKLVIPLGVFLLPSFVCLGIIPIIFGLIETNILGM